MYKLLGIGLGLSLMFAATPSSTNYTLKTYDVGGSGGTSSSSSYNLNATAGSQSGATGTSTSYQDTSGVAGANTSNVPPAPTFTNPSNYYDKLKLVLNTGGNPTDTKYLIAISDDNFATTRYVQSDNGVGSSQAITNYQSYTSWGGASGFTILGLLPSTTYQVKVKALQGSFSGSAFGPAATAATISTTLTMTLTTSLTSSPPFPSTFTSLTPGSVTTANADIILQLTSNANGGGTAYIKSANAGLSSTQASTSIPSATADLTVANRGYGAQVTSTSQSSGGPLTSQSPFSSGTNNVGGLTTALQPLFKTVGPITGGSGTVQLKAKASATDASANDYADILTLVLAMTF